MMCVKQPVFKLPNDLIRDPELNGSARRLAAALYAHRNALGVCHKTVKALAALTGMAEGTVKRAAKQLNERGYVSMRKTYYYSKKLRAVVRGRTEYICDLSFQHGFTFVPRDVFKLELGKSAFSILLYLYCCAGNGNKAFPSISDIQAATGAARSTVCEALRALKELPMLLIRRCVKRNRAFASSSYIFTHVLESIRSHAERAVEATEETVAEVVSASTTRLWRCVRSGLRNLAVRLLKHIPFFSVRG